MKKGLIATALSVCLAVSPAQAQSQGGPQLPVVTQELNAPWQPPNTECLDCPDIGPVGYRFYSGVEYLLWWSQQDRRIQPILTTVGDGEGFSISSGSIGFGSLAHSGVRAMLGCWLDQHQCCAFEIGGFWLCERSPSRSLIVDGNEGDNNQEGSGFGGFNSQFQSRIWGAEANLRTELFRGTWANLDFLAGVRYLQLSEALSLSGGDYEEDFIASYSFGSRNRFLGGQLGIETEMHWSNWFLNVWGKVALGQVNERIGINGVTFYDGQTSAGGSIAPAEVLGDHRHNEFAFVPEVGLNVGCQMSEHCRVMAGYTFIYLSDAVRPGEQVNNLINTPFASGFHFHTSSFWLQGVNAGIEFRF